MKIVTIAHPKRGFVALNINGLATFFVAKTSKGIDEIPFDPSRWSLGEMEFDLFCETLARAIYSKPKVPSGDAIVVYGEDGEAGVVPLNDKARRALIRESSDEPGYCQHWRAVPSEHLPSQAVADVASILGLDWEKVNRQWAGLRVLVSTPTRQMPLA